MRDELSQQQIDGIVKALDEMLENGPWDTSNFLRVIGKNLKEIREDFLQHIKDKQGHSYVDSGHAAQLAKRAGQEEVYVSLYATEGGKLQSWERIISNLPRQMISRPIYSDEEDVKALIHSKENKLNEAYVAIYVNQSDILPLTEDKTPMDKLGKKLLTLKDKSLHLDSISRFVHLTGVYDYGAGRLTLKG